MSLEKIIGKISDAGKIAKNLFLACTLSITISCSSSDPDVPRNYPPTISTFYSAEARTDRNTEVRAYVFDADLEFVDLHFRIGNGPENITPMSYYGNNEFVGDIPAPRVNDVFLENPADYLYFRIVAYDSAGSSIDPPAGYYYTKLYASEYDARDAIWFVLDSAEMQGFFYPMTYLSESVYAKHFSPWGNFEADVDVMDYFYDGFWYSPYFGFEYLIDGDYESDRVPNSGYGFTPSEIAFIENYQMDYPWIGPAAVWLIDKGSIREVEDAVWDGLFAAKYMAVPPYY